MDGEIYLEECPACKAGEVRITYEYSAGYPSTRSDPGEGPSASGILCRRCGERLDDYPEVVEECIADAEGRREEAHAEALGAR